MKRPTVIIGLISLIIHIFLITPILAQQDNNGSDLQQKVEEKQKEIDELEAKLGEIKSTKNTLNNQVSYFNNQITLTTLKINQTEKQINQIREQINSLSNLIDQLDIDLDRLSALLAERIVRTYKTSGLDHFKLFMQADGFADLFNRYKYIRAVQEHDKQVIYSMAQTREIYDQQKALKVEKQLELNDLQDILGAQNIQLNTQKNTKEALLEATKSDEKKYQELLAAARAEQAAITAAISQAIKSLRDGSPVEKGAIIALMGNTGYSTAPHLHFEITDKDGGRVNPANYLAQLEVREIIGNKCPAGICWDISPDSPFSFSGDWEWPMRGGIRITQGFGMTWWANSGFYNGGPHTGIDIVGDNNTTIYAPKSGTIYTGMVDGAGANYVAIEHDNVISWYWHVQ